MCYGTTGKMSKDSSGSGGGVGTEEGQWLKDSTVKKDSARIQCYMPAKEVRQPGNSYEMELLAQDFHI